MKEKQKPSKEKLGGDGGNSGDSIFDQPIVQPNAPALVAVASGPYVENLPVGGKTVGEIRRRFAINLDIDPRSVAVLNGADVGDDTTVSAGQTLTFMHRAGEKGV